MSTYIPKFTSGTRPSSPTYYSPATDSSAKKYVTNDAVANNSPTYSTSNVEHLINLASGMRSLSLSVSSLAIQAKAQINNAIDAVMQVDGVRDPLTRKPTVQYSEEDVNKVQTDLVSVSSQFYSKVTDSTIRDQLIRQMHNQVMDSRHTFIPMKMENMNVVTTNPAIPQIEHIEIEINKNAGATDNFYAGITFNLPIDQSQNVRLIRIFRADLKSPIRTKPPVVISSNGMQRLQSYRGVKTQNTAAVTALRFDELNIPNAVSLLNYVNPFTGQRVSAMGVRDLLIPPPLPYQKTPPNLDVDHLPEALSHIDKSVAGNINVIYNLQNNPVLGVRTVKDQESTVVGADRVTGSFSPIVIDNSNNLEFKEIAHFTPDGLTARIVGNVVEYYYPDTNVVYGGGYKYFIVTVDNEAVQSARSAVVTAVVEGLRVPPRPLSVNMLINKSSVTLTVVCSDQLTEKFEIYRKENTLSPAKQSLAQTISDQNGYTVSFALRDIGKNDFLLVGEILNSIKSGATFNDSSTIPGRLYTYRVYSVDIFGNKSESPFEVDAYIPDAEQYVNLGSPTILAEIDATTHKVKLTFSCDNPLIQKLTLQRRDLTLGEETFSVPSAPSRIIFGYGHSPIKNRPSMSGERIFNQSLVDAWTGVFDNSGQQTFIDRTVQYDHVYQYRLYGEDRYGNKTSYAITSPITTVRRPLINPPVSLTASVSINANGAIQGISVSWMPGTLDVSAGEQMGSQSNLSNTSVRTLYQVQRKNEREDKWVNFPLISGTSMIDPLNMGAPAPAYRPDYVDINEFYQYRVQAMQTGAFISNFTNPVRVFSGYNIDSPVNFSLKTPATSVKPFYVMLNWDVLANSGVVDRWEIEKAEMNNFAATSLNINNPSTFANLKYNPFRIVYRESSRFSGKETDSVSNKEVNSQIIVATNYYMDTQIDFGNSYFYRIRAISPEGRISGWTYKGIKITSAAFEQKYQPLISDNDKKELLDKEKPLIVAQIEKTGISSYSLQPMYSRPRSMYVDKKWYDKEIESMSEED